MMKVELLVSEWCASCHQAEKVWREVAAERDFEFSVLDMGQPEGKALVSRLRLKTIPALIIDGELKGIGVQSLAEARKFVELAPPKIHTSMQHAGLSLSVDNRWFILSALAYLAIGGAGLILNASLLSDGPARPLALHFLTLGFMVFLLYGLGAHMLPRFTGNPILQGIWPWLQMGLAHAGMLAYAAGFLFGVPTIALSGGVLAWVGLIIFTARLWPVLWPRYGGQSPHPDHPQAAPISLRAPRP